MDNVIVFHEMVKNKQYAEAYEPWLVVYEECPDASKIIYTDGVKIIETLYNSISDNRERRRLAELSIELQDKRIQYYGNDPKFPATYILGEKGLAYLNFWGDEKLMEAHECLQQSVRQLGKGSKLTVLTRLVDTSYELYKQNPELNKSEFIADYYLVRNLLEALAADPNNKNAEFAEQQKQYVDAVFAISGAL